MDLQEILSVKVGPVSLSMCGRSNPIVLPQAFPSLCPQLPLPPTPLSQVHSSTTQPTSQAHIPSAVHSVNTPYISSASPFHLAQVVVGPPLVLGPPTVPGPHYNSSLHNTPTSLQQEDNASS